MCVCVCACVRIIGCDVAYFGISSNVLFAIYVNRAHVCIDKIPMFTISVNTSCNLNKFSKHEQNLARMVLFSFDEDDQDGSL